MPSCASNSLSLLTAGETTTHHQDRSHAPRPAGQAGADLAASLHHSCNQTRGSRWHRELLRLFWKRKSKAVSRKPKVAEESIALIREMARDNRLWDAERIRGELLKLGLRVCKRTIQKDMRTVCTKPSRGQKWSTDLAHSRRTDLGPATRFSVSDLFFHAARRTSS